jgi:signal transduction histidine kinase
MAKMALCDSLEKELKYVAEANEIETALTISGEYREIDAEKKLMAFRIVQEAINNAVKHSRATQINVSLAFAKSRLTVVITDNGNGFDTERIQGDKGLGLRNMHERARLLGDIQITSKAGEGTAITLNINTDE